MKTVVSEKGQITIPKPLRIRLGLRKGQVLEVREERGHLVLANKEMQSSLDRAFGVLKLGRTTDELMEELRGRRPR